MKKITTLVACCLLLITTTTAQTIITVDNIQGANAQFNDLQSAINSASNGDIIYVHASETSYGDIFINKGLALIGFSHSAADKKTILEFVTLGANASNTKISGVNIRRNLIVDNPTVITNLVFENNLFDSSSVSNIGFLDAGANNVIFRGNIIQGVGSNTSSTNVNVVTNVIYSNNIFLGGGLVVRFHESTTVENNIFLNSRVVNVDSATGDQEVEDCIFYKLTGGQQYNPNSNGVVFNNCLSYASSQVVPDLVGNNNLNDIDPLFVAVNPGNNVYEPLSEDYNLQSSSPAKGAGTSGDDIGLYSTNTNFSFNNFGFTAGIPTVNITAITSQIAPGGTLEVTIESNSN